MSMDPFTQRMLERAEQRSKALGITNKAKIPLTEYNQEPQTITPHKTMTSSPSKKTPSPTKRTLINDQTPPTQTSASLSAKEQIHRSGSIQVLSSTKESKENCDLAVEINITTGPNVQIQVEVEEQDIDEHGNILSSSINRNPINALENDTNKDMPMIRDSSRNRLQRLGALYSDTENLSSPIHRNEARFDDNLQQTAMANQLSTHSVRPTKRIGKLAALADSINNWEDDLSHSDTACNRIYKNIDERKSPTKSNEPKIVATSLRKPSTSTKVVDAQVKSILSPTKSPHLSSSTSQRTVATNSNDSSKNSSKQLKWDQNVMDALEQQGFQRRESTNSKLTYDFKGNNRELSTVQSPKKPQTSSSSPKVDVSRGLVSGRAALFENAQKSSTNAQKSHKDPAELPIKERLALFEKNKGNALIPKAALGMAPSVKQIMADRKEEKIVSPSVTSSAEKSKINSFNKAVFAESNAAGNSIRSTVAALMSNATTLSESQIAADIRKQREKEMNVLLNRYNQPTNEGDFVTNVTPPPPPPVVEQQIPKNNNSVKHVKKPAPPPPAPPMPTNLLTGTIPRHVETKCFIKRKSNENFEDDENPYPQQQQQKSNIDSSSKRLKVNPLPKAPRLYPVLSDIESTTTGGTESDHDNCTTASVSEDDHLNHHRRQSNENHHYNNDSYGEQYDDEDSYMEEYGDSSAGICDVSLGREIMQAVRQNDQSASKINQQSYYNKRNSDIDRGSVCNNDSSTASEDGDVMDEYLDEALEIDEDNSEDKTTPKKGSVSSNSFSYAKSPSKQLRNQTIYENDSDNNNEDDDEATSYKTPIRSELTVNPSDDNNLVTLTHTVSFYRRQQSQSVSNTPVRKVTYADHRESTKNEPMNEDIIINDHQSSIATASTSSQSTNDREVANKVAKLSMEIDKQHQMMKQTSQALNLCAATFEFSGSTESVDAERHLLVATQRREAALHELARLQHQKCLRLPNAPTDRGRLTIREITIPLRSDYKEKMDSSTICGHHLVCLLRCNEYVEATRTVPTLPGLLAVKFPDSLQIKDVYADFKATLEIYGMIAQREVLPHDIKYHINKKGANKTPKKKGAESRLIMPPIESAGGPNVVRTPALSRYGVVEFSLREIQRPSWQLTKVTGVSPLQGVVHMKVNCELSVSIDHKGFLTMFEDVAGFGAWHRRWCRLHGHLLSYWRYPDDEKTKAPMGSIDLKNCCTKQVTTAPRDICARLNTFLFECKRLYQDDDKESLIIMRQGKYTIIRHLLSADTKQERETWCAHLNKALVVIRSWEQSTH